MRSILRLALVALSFELALVPTLASAQMAVPAAPTKTTPADEAAAKKHFDAGVKLYAETVLDGALAEFEQSYRLGGRASALRNYAQVLRDLKRYADAYDAYQALLARHPAQLKPKDKTDVQHAVEELKNFVGSIDVVADPVGAEVRLDGRLLGTSPLGAAVHVNVGSHKVSVTATGREPFEQDVTVVAEQTAKISATLAPEITTGKLVIKEQSGQPCRVFVDNVDVGPAPWQGDLPPGAHVVRVKGDRVESETQTVEITKKGNLEIVLVAEQTYGTLALEVEPAAATVTLDGKVVGKGTLKLELEPGQHTVTTSAGGYETWKGTIEIKRGVTLAKHVSLAVTPAAIVAPTAEPPESPFKGPYVGLRMYYLRPLHSPVSWEDMPIGSIDSDRTGKTTFGDPSKTEGPFGGGFALSAGYNFDPIGIELVVASLGQYTRANRIDGLVATDYKITSFSGFGGLGGRVTSRDSTVRFTFGASIGAVYRDIKIEQIIRISGPEEATNTSHVQTFAPAMLFDAALLVGSTPGTKLWIGMQAWLDFPGRQDLGRSSSFPVGQPGGANSGRVSYQPPTMPAEKGTQFYIGPSIGLQLAH